LSAFVETAQHDIEIVTDSNIVSRYMGQADLAVSGGGRTVCELASLGIPTIVISQDSREYAHVLARESLGVVDLGLATDFQEDRFAEVFTELLSCPALRQKMHHALLECDIRSGTERVLGVIQGLLNSLRQGTIGQTTGEKR